MPDSATSVSGYLTSIPGDIPGLLRAGSVLCHNGRRAVALHVIEDFVLVAHHASGADEEIEVEGGTVPWGLVALDLTDPTGRAHAAWWVQFRIINTPDALPEQVGMVRQCVLIIRCALSGLEMTPIQIDILARLVLRLAGRTP